MDAIIRMEARRATGSGRPPVPDTRTRLQWGGSPVRKRIMSQYITAVVEGGRLRPTEPLPPGLAEGAEVKVMILPAAPEPPKKSRSPEEVRAIIAKIAAMP